MGKVGQTWPKLVKLAPDLTKIPKHPSKSNQNWSNSAKLVELAPRLVDVAGIWPESLQNWPCSADSGRQDRPKWGKLVEFSLVPQNPTGFQKGEMCGHEGNMSQLLFPTQVLGQTTTWRQNQVGCERQERRIQKDAVINNEPTLGGDHQSAFR